jgi:hypothetical protein
MKIDLNYSVFYIPGLCVLLRRFVYPNRLQELSPMFHRRKDELSRIVGGMIKHIYGRFGFLIESLNLFWLERDFLAKYAETIRNKGAPLSHCWGFIDGNGFYLFTEMVLQFLTVHYFRNGKRNLPSRKIPEGGLQRTQKEAFSQISVNCDTEWTHRQSFWSSFGSKA